MNEIEFTYQCNKERQQKEAFYALETVLLIQSILSSEEYKTDQIYCLQKLHNHFSNYNTNYIRRNKRMK